MSYECLSLEIMLIIMPNYLNKTDSVKSQLTVIQLASILVKMKHLID